MLSDEDYQGWFCFLVWICPFLLYQVDLHGGQASRGTIILSSASSRILFLTESNTILKELALVLVMSAALIFLALVSQFNNAVKPILVFAAVPYGAVGALAALYIMGTPFGFMAFLGIVSLVGVIISHVIVLFDFIEEAHERGEPLIDSLLDTGIARLRPVMITVGATVLALFPLALHGGPLWQPLCYAQIGGLSVATFIELLLVPVLYAMFVLDLKLVQWNTVTTASAPAEVPN